MGNQKIVFAGISFLCGVLVFAFSAIILNLKTSPQSILLGTWVVLIVYLGLLFARTLSKRNQIASEKQGLNVNQSTNKSVVEELADLKKMEAYRREFLGDVSHELKTPLFNAQGYINTLIDGGLTDEKINLNYLYKASKNLDRLGDIIEDLMTISNLESGEITIQKEKFDIRELALEVFDELEVQADHIDIHLSIKDDKQRPVYVLADAGKIKQVLTNLVSNAIRYGKENGNVWIMFHALNGNVITKVIDDGIGISKEDISKIFSRFFRVDKSRKRKHGSTGLGLSIVKHIIEAHDEKMEVKSELNVGSEFSFSLAKG